MASSISTTGTNDAAFRAKHTPRPPAAMTSPATAGPSTRAALTITEFRLTALRTDSGPTISTRNAWRVGFSKASARPSRQPGARTCQSWTCR